jgi:hypothetical protein
MAVSANEEVKALTAVTKSPSAPRAQVPKTLRAKCPRQPKCPGVELPYIGISIGTM